MDNQCLDCKMKFDSSEALATHVKKFCINSDYGKIDSLDKKYAAAMKEGQPVAGVYPSDQGKDPTQIQNYGGFTLDQMKSNLKSNDTDFKKLENIVTRKREDEMIDELDKLKRDREQLRVVNEQDEQIYQQLLQETELRQEREFQARVEKDQIRKQLNEIDSWRMSVMEEQKRKELDKLLKEREQLKLKQLQLIDDIIRFTGKSRTFHQLQITNRVTDNKVITSAQYAELKGQLVKLSNRREYLEGERMRILDNMERLRLGDLGEVRRGNTSFSSRGQSILDDSILQKKDNYADIANMKDKIAKDTQRIEQLKQEQNVKSFMNKPQIEQYSDNQLEELKKLRQEYINAGGNDAKFLQNLDNLEKFYKQAKDKKDKQELNLHDESNLDHSKVVSRQQIHTSQSQKQQQQMHQSQQPQFNQQQQQNYQPEFNQQLMEQNQMLQNQLQMKMMEFENLKKQGKKKKKPEIDFNDPFDSFSKKKEFFLSNQVRGVDLTREEKIMQNLIAQEVDQLRMISRIPVGTEIYRFKMEQYKELSTMRAEMEKVVQEQRLQRIRRNFEKKRRVQDRVYENNKWVDDNRKFIIDQRLKRDFGELEPEGRRYDPTEGLVIHWDYLLGLPRRTRLCQFVYAVYNNMQQLYTPKLFEPVECEIESEATNRVLIGDSNQFYEIAAHPEVLLIIEVQFPQSKKLEENVGKTQSFAWTQLDLFDQQRQLKRGKFKCPLYVGPTDPAITIEEIAKLEPIPNAWFHLRLTYPNDEEFEQVRSIYPEQTQMEYNIPVIHLRGLFARNYEASIKGKQVDPQQRGDVTLDGQDYNLYENVQTFDKPSQQQISQDYGQQFGQKQDVLQRKQNRGVRFVIHSVQNHVAQNQLRVMAAVMFDSSLLLDDTGLPVAFNTTIHDPNSNVNSKANENNLIPLVISNPELAGSNNKASRSNIIQFHEEYRVFYDLMSVAMKRQKEMWLGFQVVEKVGGNQSQNVSTSLGEFDLLGWLFIEFIGQNGNISVGRQLKKLLAQPLQRPPYDPLSVKETKIKLDYGIYDFEYDENDVLNWRAQRNF